MAKPFITDSRKPLIHAFRVYLLSDDDINHILEDARRNQSKPKINIIMANGNEIPYTRMINLTREMYDQFMKTGGLNGISGRSEKKEDIVFCLDMKDQYTDKPKIMSEQEFHEIRKKINGKTEELSPGIK